MGINIRAVDKTGKTAAESQGSDKSTAFENVKNTIADKLHNAAEALNEKASDPGAQCGIARYGKQASGWLDQSAEYVREFNYEDADAKVRDYVRQSPGRSIAIAAAVGVVIGAILRRR